MSTDRKAHPDGPAYADFVAARNRAFSDSLTAILGRRSPSLVPFSLVRRYLSDGDERYLGLRTVALASIMGSEQRGADFTRRFAPRRSVDPHRWMSVAAALRAERELPPVVLYEIGGVYFVRDGNHRVSVARGAGVEFIDAEVYGLPSRAALSPDMDVGEVVRVIVSSVRERFARVTGLRPGNEGIESAQPEAWDALLAEIERYRLLQGEDVDLRDAARSWHSSMFLPLVGAARRAGVLRRGGEVEFYLLASSWKAEYEELANACLDSDDLAPRYLDRFHTGLGMRLLRAFTRRPPSPSASPARSRASRPR
jgi:hypothetical protein